MNWLLLFYSLSMVLSLASMAGAAYWLLFGDPLFDRTHGLSVAIVGAVFFSAAVNAAIAIAQRDEREGK